MTKLKCWKKGIGGDEWSGKNDKYSYVRVWKTGLPSKEIKRRNIKPNIFSGRIGRNGTRCRIRIGQRDAAVLYLLQKKLLNHGINSQVRIKNKRDDFGVLNIEDVESVNNFMRKIGFAINRKQNVWWSNMAGATEYDALINIVTEVKQ